MIKTLKNEELLKKVYTLKEVIEYAAEKHKNNIAIKYYDSNKNIEDKSYIDLKNDVEVMSSYLINNKLNKSNIAIIGDISYEWIVSYYAIASSGAVVVPIDKELSAKDIMDLLVRIDAKCIFFGKTSRRKIEEIVCNLNTIEKLISLQYLENYETVSEILKEKKNDKVSKVFIKPDDLASIVFTSGTTGKSKGVMLTHRNLCEDLMYSYYLVGREGNEATVPILPVYHMFEITTGIQCPIYIGFTICIGKGIKYITKSIEEFKPTILTLVPLVVEMLHKNIWMEARKRNKDSKLKFALKVSRFFRHFGIDLRRILFKDIIENFGGRLHTIVCGGAPLRKELEEEFNEFGITLLNGYGITECAPVLSCNMRDHIKSGSVGQPLKEFCEIKIIDGEIYVKGDIIMKGYYNDRESTKEAFKDGWFKTGDIGYLDEDGYLFITGRKKNLIILDNGENVSPEELEDIFIKSDFVKEIVVYADENNSKNQISAFIVPDKDYFKKNQIEDIEGVINKEVASINRTLPYYKRVQIVNIREEEFVKTSTGKVKRHEIRKEELNDR